jgi:hypothetical protein
MRLGQPHQRGRLTTRTNTVNRLEPRGSGRFTVILKTSWPVDVGRPVTASGAGRKWVGLDGGTVTAE